MTNFPSPTFDGSTFVPSRDHSRLATQLRSVLAMMGQQEWWTLDQLSAASGHPPASVSARLRDLRKPKFGGHQVQREYVTKGLFRYKLIPNSRKSPVDIFTPTT